MAIVRVDFSEMNKEEAADTLNTPALALDLIFGPPTGVGAFAVSPGYGDNNAPGLATFYPNTVPGRKAYIKHSEKWEAEGRNNFLNSALWDDSVLSLPNRKARLSVGDDVYPYEFRCLWVDVDKGTTPESKALLRELLRKGCILVHSGGKTDEGKNRFHLRVLLADPLYDVDEFYALNRWLAVALGGEKFAPVSWLTLPGSRRFKDEYGAGGQKVSIQIARGDGELWRTADLRKVLKKYADEPASGGRGEGMGATDLVSEPPQGAVPKLIQRLLRQADSGDGTSRYKQTNKLVKTCAEEGWTQNQTLWALEQHAPSVGKFGYARLGSQVVSCWPEGVAEEQAQALEPVEDADLLSDMFDGGWLGQQTFEPLVWSVPDLIPEGLGMLVAPPKAGKSWLVADVGLACASGGKALGAIDVDKRPVLYMALEDSKRRLQDRTSMLMGGKDKIPAGIHFMLECQPNVLTATILAFLARYAGSKPLIFVDTLGKARGAGGKDDSYAADYAFTSQLKNAIDQVPGATLLMVHHTRKAESGDFVDSASGTQGIAGAMDFILALQRKRNEKSARLHLTGRDVEEDTFNIVFEAGHWALDGENLKSASSEAGDQLLGDTMQKVLDRVNLTEEITAKDLVVDLGLNPSTAGVYLTRLLTKELICKKARGVYGPLESI